VLRVRHATELENTTLALALSGGRSMRSVSPYRPHRPDPFFLQNQVARHSAQVRAWNDIAEYLTKPDTVEYVTQTAAVWGATLLVANAVKTQLMPGGRTAPEAIKGTEALMARKAHGTCPKPVQSNLKWGCDRNVADKICAFNRHGAESAGYWEKTGFLNEETGSQPVTFYDSVTGKPLFVAPVGRTWDQFLRESGVHGWPSFRDEEVVQENVRVLGDGETVSVDGTHLGHNLPDGSGNRYCINLVSVAGNPEIEVQEMKS